MARDGWHVDVDPTACEGFGWCAELFPERVALDEWGYPVLDGRPLDGNLLALARTAAKVCPRRAFRLVVASSPSAEPAPPGGHTGERGAQLSGSSFSRITRE